ncbi:unannotated protein [freshwater metagenome]|uniref:Unannotated protein n=1 Tax=freshwater metagenome TaxID=449393 RepID=A0A6J6D9J0_9ZZZZ
MTKAEEQNRKFFLDVGTEQQNGATRSADLVDCCTRETENYVGRKSIAELCVDIVGSKNTLEQLRPCVGIFVGET